MGISKLWHPSLADFQKIFIINLLTKLFLGGKMKWKHCLQQDMFLPRCCLLRKNGKRFLTQSAWGKYCSLWVTSTMVLLSSRSIFRIPSCMRWSLRWISRAENGSSWQEEKGSAFGARTYRIQGNWQVLIPVKPVRSIRTCERGHQIKIMLWNGFFNLQNTKPWTVFLKRALSNASCVNATILWGFLGSAPLPRCAHGLHSWRTWLLLGSRQCPSVGLWHLLHYCSRDRDNEHIPVSLVHHCLQVVF